MPIYTEQTWADGPGGGTPLSAARLTHIEDGIVSMEKFGVRTFDVTSPVYGAKADVRYGLVTTTAGSTVVVPGNSATTAQNMTFTTADIGKYFIINGAGATTAASVVGTITDVAAGQATVSVAPGVAVTNAVMYVGSDDTAACQAAMADAAVRGGIVLVPVGLYFANIKQYPSTMIVGQGKGSVLFTRPDATVPIIGTSAVDGVEPYDMGVCDLQVNGLWQAGQGGPNVRLIDYESVNNDAFSTPVANWPWSSGDGRYIPINDRVPMLSRIRAANCGADYAVYLGKNMRSAEVDSVYIYRGAGWGMRVDSTDSHFTNMDVGGFADNIWISGQLNTYRNAKAWYALQGVTNKGPNGQGGCGWYVTGTGNDVSSCQSQDNVTDGLILEGTSGCKFDAFTSSGDAGSAVRLKSVAGAPCTYNSGSVLITPNGDRWAPGSILAIDGAATQHNKVYIEAAIGTIQGLPGLGSGNAKIVLVNGGLATTNEIKVGRSGGVGAAFTVTAAAPTYTPDPQYGGLTVVTLQNNATIANTPGDGGSPSGTMMAFLFAQDATGGRTVTWGNQYHNMPQIDLQPSAVTLVVVYNLSGNPLSPSWWAVQPTTAAQGTLARATTTTTTNSTTNVNDIITTLISGPFTLTQTRRIRVTVQGVYSTTTAGDLQRWTVRDSGSAANPAQNSAAFGSPQPVAVPTNLADSKTVTFEGTLAAGTHNLGVSIQRVSGTGTTAFGNGTYASTIIVEDIGGA